MRLGTVIIRELKCSSQIIKSRRWCSSFGFKNKPDPEKIEHDYIGPPNEESNLRPIVRCVPKFETKWAQDLRFKRLEVEQWNQDFWARHNKRFYEEKEDFIKMQKANGNENISADVMSIYYKNFLDKNWKIHFYYNISWYLKNFDILTLAAAVNIQKLRHRFKKS